MQENIINENNHAATIHMHTNIYMLMVKNYTKGIAMVYARLTFNFLKEPFYSNNINLNFFSFFFLQK